MKKALFLFIAAVALVSCKDEDKPESNGILPVMTFTEQQYDFGTITQGEQVEHDFIFKNTGATELYISNAVGSCGCTVPEYPHEPIAAGANGTIKVKFNSSGKTGHQTKTVTLTTNTKARREMLTIKAQITIAG
jgi:hypothetical protein